MRPGFSPPPYPYDRLKGIAALAEDHPGGMVDCSIGTPCDPPAVAVLDALSSSGTERGYPTSQGSEAFRGAITDWLARRFAVAVKEVDVAGCIGTKEMVASTAHYLSLRDPTKSAVLFPAISYPTYAMGATLAGLEPIPVPLVQGHLDLESISDEVAARALLLWSNSPSNPTGALDDLHAAATWGRQHGVVVCSDECYADFTWERDPETILSSGLEGVMAVHSLSKRSNLAGVRAGFYTGDPALVEYLRVVRQHAGLMIPGPVQAAAAVAYADDLHVEVQRTRYVERLELVAAGLTAAGFPVELPEGTFYLWIPVPERLADGWALADELARRAGLLVSPGELYGDAGRRFARLAVVQPTDRLVLALDRLASS